MDELRAEHAAIRTRTALVRRGRSRILRLAGEGAREATLWLLPSRVHLRDAQARQSLLLDDMGTPIADVVVAADDEDYLLLLDGPGDPAAHVREHARGDVRVIDLGETHEVLDLHGPWAWELASRVLGDDILALPYLNFFRMDECLCLRAGRTGEFGYHLIVPREAADALTSRIEERGVEFDLRRASDAAVSLAGFENWFFDAHHVAPGVTPVELGLSWRLASDRDYLGRAAIEKRRAEGPARQACLVADAEVRIGDEVTLADRRVGAITRAAFSLSLEAWIASALVDPRLVCAGLDLATRSGISLHTVAPPLVDNHSLYVDPRRHAFRARDEVRFGRLEPTVSA